MSEQFLKLTVSELTALIKNNLEESFFGLSIEGEISGFKPSSTGHWYFALKDNNALINAVVWRSATSSVGFIPKDGLKVIVTGNISVYAPRGTYQISCTSMKLAGEGDILAKLEERKRFYAEKGYFDAERKKPLPDKPSRIAVITSPTGAALQDILQITERRDNSIDIIILPAVVQGNDAAISIAKRIKQVNDFALADVMIVGRGGGSIEDLLPFSEDCVIEAIYNSDIPVISAVGHEIDWAISDYVADLRAPTPSAAAELVCKNKDDRKQQLENIVNNMKNLIETRLNQSKLSLSSLSLQNFRYNMENRFTQLHLKLESNILDLNTKISDTITSLRSRLEISKAIISSSSPQDILKRGYSIVSDINSKTIRSSKDIENGSVLKIRFADGTAKVKTTEIENG